MGSRPPVDTGVTAPSRHNMAPPLTINRNVTSSLRDRHLSDHCPLVLRDKLIDYGPKPFKVFDEWFNCDEIDKVIVDAWSQPIRGSKKDCNFRDRLKNVKFALKCWSVNKFGGLDKEIDALKQEVLEWKLKAESNNLTSSDRDRWLEYRRCWVEKEKIKTNMLKQKARLKWTIEGDENSKFFRNSIRRKNSKCNFRGLNINGSWIEEPAVVKEAIYVHFQNLFSRQRQSRPRLLPKSSIGPNSTYRPATVNAGISSRAVNIGPVGYQPNQPNGPSVTVPDASVDSASLRDVNPLIPDIFKLSEAQNNELEAQFSDVEIWEAVKGCASNKAPSPDGFNMRFF
ncbi:uncharacterized protein [Rutidosis leptorrhynchoides]|uniref:uncharacterized protein n=1 Tax=Rutidosis leptorrhynchoides TaxID=125765 RepID=UPI003A9A3C46